jgi:hypothetical protein
MLLMPLVAVVILVLVDVVGTLVEKAVVKVTTLELVPHVSCVTSMGMR